MNKTDPFAAQRARVLGFLGLTIPAQTDTKSEPRRHPKAKANRARNRVARASRKANR